MERTVNTTMNTTLNTARRDAVVEQLFLGTIGALETLHVYLGDRLGLYTSLAALPDASAPELAARAGIHERYAREWLEQQAVAGLLDVVTDHDNPSARRFRLPPEVAEVMTDEGSPHLPAPPGHIVGGIRQTPAP